MQKRKNIRLLVILAILVVVTIASYLLVNSSEQAVMGEDADIFAVTDVSQIDSVVIQSDQEITTLDFENNQWEVNDEYAAEPQKLTVLFAILNQVRARRPVAEAEAAHIDSLFDASGRVVSFFEGEEVVRSFEVAGNPQTGVTYFKNDEGTFIVNIPGYRSYLAAIYELNASGWRNKLIFNEVSWNNLQSVAVGFPSSDREGFTISESGGFYALEQLASSDSLKVLDYLDRVSLLTAEQYLEDQQIADSLVTGEPVLNIAITDIRNRPFTLNIFPYQENLRGNIALKDSSQWLVIPYDVVDPLLKSKQYFQNR